MSRKWKDRRSDAISLIGRFEAKSVVEHFRNAIACLQRIRDDGDTIWEGVRGQRRRWRRSCDTLLRFLTHEASDRRRADESLENTLREFVKEFEHSTTRMAQMLHGLGDDDDHREQFAWWTQLAYRLSTYAILSRWLDDKEDATSVRINVNVTEGTRREEWCHQPMIVPKKHRPATKTL